MIFVAQDRDDGLRLTLDEDGIAWLERGLEQLRAAEPGTELTTPSLDSDADTGEPTGVSEVVLRRA